MGVFQCDELDLSIVDELITNINDHYQNSEHALTMLDDQPDDSEFIHSLFRSVHTIKGDLGMVGFTPAMPLISAVEDLLSLLREGTLQYSSVLSDLILLVLDRVRDYVGSFKSFGFVEHDQDQDLKLSEHINTIVTVMGSNEKRERKSDQRWQQQKIAEVIRLLDPLMEVEQDPLDADDSRVQADKFIADQDLYQQQDLNFFRDLMEPVEKRSQYWYGRGDRILKMSLILNELNGSPVNEQQLAVAVYVHDFGMAFMPLDLLHKKNTLSDREILQLRSHVQSSAHLLEYMEQWHIAKEIIIQHHEAADGSGYPYGLREKEICDGAKILAIADTFDALTQQRAYTFDQKRPVIRAVKEINECAGKQLSPKWVEIFNQAVQPVLLAHSAKKLNSTR